MKQFLVILFDYLKITDSGHLEKKEHTYERSKIR